MGACDRHKAASGLGRVKMFESEFGSQNCNENCISRQISGLLGNERWQILRSNADFKTVHAFSRSLTVFCRS
jgi:hypothetical protein